MKKNLILALCGIGGAVAIGTSAYFLTSGMGVTQTETNMVSELGEEVALNPSDFLEGNKKKIADAKVDISKVDVGEVGLYDATITCARKEYNVKVSIKDTVVPKFTAKKEIICGVGMPITAKDIAETISDAAKTVEVTFKDNLVTDSNVKYENAVSYEDTTCKTTAISYAEAGEYDNTIIITDPSGNKIEEPVHIIVCNLPTINANDIVAEVSTTIDYLAGVTATDYAGNDITDKVILKDASSVNVNVAGEYSAVYTVTDGKNLTSDKSVKVTIEEKPEETQNVTTENTGTNNGTTSNGGNKKPSSNGGSASNSVSNGTSNNNNGGSSSNSANNSQPSAPSTPSIAPHWVEGSSTTNGVLNASQKATIDGLVASWKNGGYSDSGLESAIDSYMEEWGLLSQVGSSRVVSNDNFVTDASESSLSANRQSYMLSSAIYSYSAVYTDGTFSGEKLNASIWYVYYTN